MVYGLNLILENGIAAILVLFNLEKLITVMQKGFFEGRMVQLSTMVIICLVISKFRIGFSFLQLEKSGSNSVILPYKKLLMTSVFGLLFIASCSYSWFHWNNAVVMVNIILLCVTFLLLRWAYKKELAD
jgi:branched-subunit amino acid transport protein AzlD